MQIEFNNVSYVSNLVSEPTSGPQLFDVPGTKAKDPGFGGLRSESAELGPLLVQLSGWCDWNDIPFFSFL